MDKERFSLLLLEPNEIYFEDFSADLIENGEKNDENEAIIGRLKMCSKSLVFDPKNISLPLIKMAYKNCDNISIYDGQTIYSETNVLLIECRQFVEMLPKNIVAPYTFRDERRRFLFKFHYARIDDYLDQLCQLHRASNLHAIEQNDMIATFVYSRHNRVKFNPLWLDDIYETIVLDCTVDEINPLILNPGRLLLSSQRMYFQPYNNIQPEPVIKINLENVHSLIKRRFLLRQIGLEIKWTENGDDRMLYVSFRSPRERDEFHDAMMEHNKVSIKETECESITLKWQNGIISNFDYLLYLNSLADRTFQDLTQYPVFPWVISDYESEEIDLNDTKFYRDLTKPIGALNEERLERLKERYDEMDEPKFLFGSHYSAPALVLFYLVRRYPKLMLCLQNGHFDHPDRMFNRVIDAFRNCLTNMADFKELIPEFYDVTQGGDFLLNQSKVNFGRRFDGTPVDHVTLPPWAKNSPKIFVEKLREALESEYVSQNLHHWIDLIFGYKQRGEEARKANNVFYHLCYEGAIDLENIDDLAKRHALEVQISEFGQIPKQLFTKPHVHRNTQRNTSRLSSVEREIGVSDEFLIENDEVGRSVCFDTLSFQAKYQSHKNLIFSLLVSGNLLTSAGKDGLLKCYNLKEMRQTRSVPISNLPISSCVKLSGSNTFFLGTWDDVIIIYDLDCGRKLKEIPAHLDAVSCLAYIESIGVLISGSWDGYVKIWKGFTQKSYNLSSSMIAYLALDDKVVAVDANRVENQIKVVIGLTNNEVVLWTLSTNEENDSLQMNSIESKVLVTHSDEVTDVILNKNATKVASCGLDQMLFVCDIETGMILFRHAHPNSLMCFDWCYFNELLFIGDNEGFIYTWDMNSGEQLCTTKAFDGPVTALRCVNGEEKNRVFVAGVDFNEFIVKEFTN